MFSLELLFHYLILLHFSTPEHSFQQVETHQLSVKKRNLEMCNKINEILLPEILRE